MNVSVLWQFEFWGFLEKAVFFRRRFLSAARVTKKCDISWLNIGEDHQKPSTRKHTQAHSRHPQQSQERSSDSSEAAAAGECGVRYEEGGVSHGGQSSGCVVRGVCGGLC